MNLNKENEIHGKLKQWAQSNSLWFYSFRTVCCGDEIDQVVGAKYDLERFGCVEQTNPESADVLFVSGPLNKKSAQELQNVYEKMLPPKFVIALGSCSCSGAPFLSIEQTIPVDVFVPGCPPRPESLLNGLIALQEKIQTNDRF